MSEGEQLTIDDYQLVECIATGNASQVWEVHQASTSKTLAMKVLLPEAISEPEQRQTMKHEAKVGRSLEHPNIIRMFDSKVSRKQAYIIMELFKAANLKGMIRNSLLSVHVRLDKLAESMASAFAYMHEKGWIHKDIKPDNILMTKGSEVRVIDFSLASKPGSSVAHMMKKKSFIAIQGTRTYIAPELIQRQKLTPSADIYSLGITLFECLTGRPPFTGTNPNALLMSHIQEKPDLPSNYHPNVSPQADALVMKMLSKRPKDRHESMQEVFTELRNIKLFKVDPLEYDKQQEAQRAEEKALTVDQRLDSRSDHEHTQKHGHRPAKPKPKKPVPPPEPQKKPAPAQPAAQVQPPMMPQQPAMPVMPPQMMPGMMPQHPGMPAYAPMPMQPGMMPPGMVPPGTTPPAQVPPAAMPPGAMPPGMPQPSMPGAPPTAPQPPPAAPQPAAGTQPPAPAPAQPPAAPAPAAPAPPPPAPQNEESDLETPEDIDWLNVM